jgi:glycosyltransferase involved in cell wall biosynthesis
VRGNLKFRGQVDHDDLMRLLHGARACVAPSRFENLSRVPGEAIAAGTALVASDIPSFREACGDAAMFFSVGSPKELAHCMVSLMHDGRLRGHLVETGRRYLEATAPTSESARILELLEELARAQHTIGPRR